MTPEDSPRDDVPLELEGLGGTSTATSLAQAKELIHEITKKRFDRFDFDFSGRITAFDALKQLSFSVLFELQKRRRAHFDSEGMVLASAISYKEILDSIMEDMVGCDYISWDDGRCATWLTERITHHPEVISWICETNQNSTAQDFGKGSGIGSSSTSAFGEGTGTGEGQVGDDVGRAAADGVEGEEVEGGSDFGEEVGDFDMGEEAEALGTDAMMEEADGIAASDAMEPGLGDDSELDTDAIQEALQNMQEGMANMKKEMNGIKKILVSYLQVATSLVVVMPNLEWPSFFSAGFSAALAPINIDMGRTVPFGCYIEISAYQMFLLHAALPLVGASAIFALMAVGRYKTRDNPEQQAAVFDGGVGKFVTMLMVLYPILAMRCLSVFSCVQIGPNFWLAADLSKMCYDSEWTTYAIISMIGVFIYILGIPTLFFSVLWAHRPFPNPNPNVSLTLSLILSLTLTLTLTLTLILTLTLTLTRTLGNSWRRTASLRDMGSFSTATSLSFSMQSSWNCSARWFFWE